MIHFEKTSAPDKVLRDAYLDSLVEPQELFVELQVSAGSTWSFDDDAYGVVRDDMLVEFFVVREEATHLVELFDALMHASGASTVLCKSFDRQLAYAGFSRAARISTVGLLFRRIADPKFVARDEVSFLSATAADAHTVLEFNEDFFEDIEEILAYAEIDGLFLLERDGEVIGCGIGKPVVESRPEIDIGMLVAPKHRRLGYGSHVIEFLKDHYLRKGLRPICGCSIDNIGSQRALINAGFVSEHRLLQISYESES